MRKLLLSVLAMFAFMLASATHNMAGRISCSNLSGYTYEITIETYTNTVNTNADRCDLMLYFGNGDSARVPRVNGPSSICPSTHDGLMMTSSCFNGLKYNVYRTTVTYSSPGMYHLSVIDYNRSAGILNIANSVNTPFTLSADLVVSPFLGPNHTPVPSNLPVVCSAINIPYNYNPSFTDSDGDSLYYEDFLRGTAGYSNPAASNSFFVDSLTGNVVWDQPNNIGNYVYDIKISEWRKVGSSYYLIGTSVMEVWSTIRAWIGVSENNEKNFSLNVFPNPSSGHITFDLTEIPEGDLIVNNNMGQLIKTVHCEHNSVSLSNLPTGIYFYRFISPGKVHASGKFVISEGSLK
ncbi:MAG: hypothetical protein K0Q95_1893 [Bacteroidota bacterium]|jgi:hypothetical protein|nr:hypothetical protein [Bacteroidota bacterium]